MSEKFTGVTFAKQKVTPSDDAIIRRAILPDGVLTGCELSYSGSTLTMKSGHLMICGRQIRMPSVQNWAVVDATSGYARLVLTIDLTRTATKDTFDQVIDSIEYASAEDGFVALEQSDINTSGIRYQVSVCTVSLGSGGITGIVSQIEKSAVDGSGALNFSVVGGMTQPSDRKENTIWVSTSEKITSWVFSAAEPKEPAEGMVWFSISTSSPVAFNALKKNGIEITPGSAKQYLSGAWVNKPAKTFQNGEWVDWWDNYLFKAGDVYESITGGFVTALMAYSNTVTGTAELTVTNENGAMTIKHSSAASKAGAVHTAEKIDLSDFDTLYFDGILNINGDNVERVALCIWSEIGAYREDNRVAYLPSDGKDGIRTLDISELPGEYYIGFFMYSHGGATVKPIIMRNMWLE